MHVHTHMLTAHGGCVTTAESELKGQLDTARSPPDTADKKAREKMPSGLYG